MRLTAKDLSPETVDLIQTANGDPEVVKLRKELTLYKKNDPGLAMMRSKVTTSIMKFNEDLGRALDKYKRFPSDSVLEKLIDKNWKRAGVVDDFEGMFKDYCLGVIAKVKSLKSTVSGKLRALASQICK